jgi:hypothetical protein
MNLGKIKIKAYTIMSLRSAMNVATTQSGKVGLVMKAVQDGDLDLTTGLITNVAELPLIAYFHEVGKY